MHRSGAGNKEGWQCSASSASWLAPARGVQVACGWRTQRRCRSNASPDSDQVRRCIRRGTVSATRCPPFPSRAELTAPAVDGNLESRQRQGRDNQGQQLAVILIPQIFSSPQVVNPGAFSGLTLLRPAWLDIAPPPNRRAVPDRRRTAARTRAHAPAPLPSATARSSPTSNGTRASDGPIAARLVCPAARPRPSPSPHRHAQQPFPCPTERPMAS